VIKARGQTTTGPLLVFGLTRTNVDRLMAGQPIKVDCAELGLHGIRVLDHGRRNESRDHRRIGEGRLLESDRGGGGAGSRRRERRLTPMDARDLLAAIIEKAFRDSPGFRAAVDQDGAKRRDVVLEMARTAHAERNPQDPPGYPGETAMDWLIPLGENQTKTALGWALLLLGEHLATCEGRGLVNRADQDKDKS
jgi:hypothetical protein